MSNVSPPQAVSNELSVKPVGLPDVDESAGQGASLLDNNLSLVQGVKVKLEVVVGEAEITIGDLFNLKDGSTLKLEQDTAALVDIRLDGRTIARGHLMAVGDNLGIRIEEISQEVS